MIVASVVLVTTDSGGSAWQTNRPLRGARDTYYQGGIRGVSFLSSPLLSQTGYTYPGLLPAAMAGFTTAVMMEAGATSAERLRKKHEGATPGLEDIQCTYFPHLQSPLNPFLC